MENDIKEDSLRSLRDELYEDYGIHFPERKFYQLKAKIRKRLRKLNLDSINSYRRYLEENPREVSNFLDTISTNTTRFYREPRHWDFYEELLETTWENRSLKMWSAACSSGEEPYTLAMITEDHRDGPHPEINKSSDYKILATDLSASVLQSGITGRYDDLKMDNLRESKPNYVHQFFNPVGENEYEILDPIKDRITFRQFNLKTKKYPYDRVFDLILIRNVLIYFDRTMTEHVIENLTRGLRPGGYLFVGHSESLSSVQHSLEKVQPAIYRKPD